jgi:hypothetical protein
MNRMRTLLQFLSAITIALFALTVDAAQSSVDKQFGIAVNPTVLVAGAVDQPVTVTFTNRSPKNGNSYINSVKLVVPAGVTSVTFVSATTINGTTSTPGGASAPLTVGPGGMLSINGFTGVKPGGSLQLNLKYSVDAAATCSVSAWTGAAYTGNSFNGDPFVPYPSADSNVAPAYVGCDGILACNDPTVIKPANLGANSPGYAATTRSFYNKDGTTNGTGCVPVPYSFTNQLIASNQLHLKWLSQETAVFTTSANSALRALDPVPSPGTGPSGWTDAKRPRVAWVESAPNVPVPVPGLACLGTNPPTNLPAPYGTLSAAIGTSTGPISITAMSGGAVLPTTTSTFPIVIGTERMTIQYDATLGTFAMLTRGEGGTGPAVTHAAGALVMSTPLPLIPNIAPFNAFGPTSPYFPGNQAQMCVLEYGWQSGGVNANGEPLVFDFATVIDIGDGWVFPN